MKSYKDALIALIKNDEGLTTVEYAIAGGLIGLAVVVAFRTLGVTVGGVITAINAGITPAAWSRLRARLRLHPVGLRLAPHRDWPADMEDTRMVQQLFPGATGLLVAFVGAIALVDLATRRIPKALNLAGAAVGVATHIWSAGPAGLLQSAGGLLVGFLVFLPFYVAGGFGAGDVKAMAAIGTFLGAKGALLAAAWVLLAGGMGGIAR